MQPQVPIIHPIESLESPYHNLPNNEKTRVQAAISTEDLLKLRSFFPRKGLADAIISTLLRGFVLHLQSLNLQVSTQNFYKNERIINKLLQQYVPGTHHSRINYSLNDTGTPEPTVLPPR